MTITRRTLAIISVAMLVVAIFIYIIISRVFMNSILSFEKRAMEEAVVQAANAIAFDVMNLEKFASDWSVWTESRDFVRESPSEAPFSPFAAEYLVDSTFAGQGLNVILYVNNDGQLVYAKWFDLATEQEISVSDEITARLYQDPLLLSQSAPRDAVRGLINLPAGPLMLVSEPIYDSWGHGSPQGHLMVGRYLDDREWMRLNQITRLNATMIPAPYDGSAGQLDVFAAEGADVIGIDVQTDDETAAGTVFIRDIHGEPAFRMLIQKNRAIYYEGLESAALIAGSLGITAMLVLLAIFLLIKRHVLDRVIALTARIEQVSSLENIPDLVDQGEDEIALMTFHIQKMLNQLKDSHDRSQYMNSYDPLTKVHNRSYYERFLAQFSGCGSQPRGVIVCDIDGLQLANDLVGHQYGDELLCRVSAALVELCPEDAMIARVGGDEFVAIIADGRESFLNNLCCRIQNRVLEESSEDRSLVSLSLSLGFAGSDAESLPLGELVRLAENLMRREKLHRSQSGSSSLVSTLRSALGARDYLTEGHASRMRELTLMMAPRMGMTPRSIPDLLLFTEFHDVGKIGVPDSILFKPGPLDEGERARMRRHCEIGHEIAIATTELAPIADFILKHHEWWNGEGYPLGLREEEIPLECRILAVVDAWDAMTNDRPYRGAMSVSEAIAELRRGSGGQFDPRVVDKFVSIIEIEAASA